MENSNDTIDVFFAAQFICPECGNTMRFASRTVFCQTPGCSLCGIEYVYPTVELKRFKQQESK